MVYILHKYLQYYVGDKFDCLSVTYYLEFDASSSLAPGFHDDLNLAIVQKFKSLHPACEHMKVFKIK